MEQASHKKYKRKFLVLKPFQLKLVIILAVVTVALIFVSAVALYFTLDRTLEDAMFTSHVKVQNLSELFMPMVWQVNTAFSILLIIIFGMVSGYMLERIKSSLRDMNKKVKKIGKLNFSGRTGIYRNEAVEDMVKAFENMKSSLNDKMSDVADAANNLSDSASAIGSGGFDSAKAKREINAIKEALGHFE